MNENQSTEAQSEGARGFEEGRVFCIDELIQRGEIQLAEEFISMIGMFPVVGTVNRMGEGILLHPNTIKQMAEEDRKRKKERLK